MGLTEPQAELAAGYVSGVGSMLVSQPFDTIKVRLQTSDAAVYRGPLDCARQTVAKEGWSALYKGLLSPVLTEGAKNAVVFAVHGAVLRQLVGADGERSQTWAQFSAGAVAGWSQCCVATPSELVKCRLQVSGGAAATERYAGNIDCIRRIVAAEGVTGLYRGNVAMMARETCFGIWFASYDAIKGTAGRAVGRGAGDEGPLVEAISGAAAGCATWAPIYPIDVVKSRIQTGGLGGSTSLLGGFVAIAKAEGAAAFFRGFGTTMMRAMPCNAVVFPFFEFTKRTLSERLQLAALLLLCRAASCTC